METLWGEKIPNKPTRKGIAKVVSNGIDPDHLVILQKCWFNGYLKLTGSSYMFDGKLIGQLKTIYKLCDNNIHKAQGVLKRYLLTPGDTHTLGLLLYNFNQYVDETIVSGDATKGLKIYDARRDDRPPVKDEPDRAETPNQASRGPGRACSMDEKPSSSTPSDSRKRDSDFDW